MRIISILGLFTLILIGYILSENRRLISWRVVIWGSLLQIILGVAVLLTPPGRWLFEAFNSVFIKIISFSEEGARFVFGNLVDDKGVWGFIFAFKVLTTIIFFSAFIQVLYYFGVMQFIVEVFARIMVKTMGTSGAETLSASANIFVGQTEAPLVVRPYVKEMTRSELLAVMTGGMATIAGGVMAAYVLMLKDYIPDIAGHLLTASVMSSPAALVFAKLLIPETEEPKTLGHVKVAYEKTDVNIIDAVANGTTLGLQLAFNVGAMLVSFMSLLAMLNFLLSKLGVLIPFEFMKDLSLQKIFGFLFYPVAFIIGCDPKDLYTAAQLIGVKTALNEFVAYLDMAKLITENPEFLSYRTRVVLAYALCGFSNFLSIGIQIGGIGAIAPEKKHELARLGIKALIAGTLACLQTATIAGIFIT